jgi:anti-sigma B factor antagonist
MEFHRDEGADGVLILAADNEIDAACGSGVVEDLQAALTRQVRTLIIDCSRVGYVSSGAICTLIRLHKRLVEHDGELRLAAVQPPLLRVLAITRLSEVFPVFPSVEAARRTCFQHAPD